MIHLRRALFSVVLLFGGLGAALAQSSWTVQKPYRASHDLNGIVWTGSQWVAVGDSGTVATSPDARTWTARNVGTIASGASHLNAVTWTGSQLVAVGLGGQIWTSPDGIAWTNRVAIASPYKTLNAVVWAGVQLVAVGNDGAVVTSFDGIAWTQVSSGATLDLTAVAFSGNSIKAVGGESLSLHMRGNDVVDSPDGVTWTVTSTSEIGGDLYIGVAAFNGAFQRSIFRIIWTGTSFLEIHNANVRRDGVAVPTGSTSPLRALAADSAGNIVAVGDDGVILHSADGGTKWTSGLGMPNSLLSIRTTGTDLLLLGAESSLHRSTNQGSTWNSIFSKTPKSNGDSLFSSFLWTGSRYVIGSRGMVFTSSDGVAWDKEDVPVLASAKALAHGNDITVGAFESRIASKVGANAWVQRTSSAATVIHAIAWTGSRFVGVGQEGVVTTSTDGVSWTDRSPGGTGTTQQLNSLAWTGNHLVAVGANGTVRLSTDGLTWLGFPSGTNKTLLDVAWTGTGLTAVGADGIILTSPNGVVWTIKTSGTTDSLLSVVRSGNRLFAVSSRGALLSSPVDSPLFVPATPALTSPSAGEAGIALTPTLSWTAPAGAASYRVQVSTSPTFATLVADGSTATPSLALGSLATGKPYYWRVRALGGDGNSSFWSPVSAFSTGSGALSAPILSAPAHDSMNVALSTLLNWNAVSGATAYGIQVSDNPAFSPALVLNDSAFADVNRVLGGLSSSKTYYWRVRGKNASGFGPWSVARRFSTGTVSIPGAPVLVSPSHHAEVAVSQPMLIWKTVPGASQYRVQASRDSTFLLTVLDDSVATDTSISTSPLAADGAPYYWRVYARSAAAASAFSETRSFIVLAPLPTFTLQPASRTVVAGAHAGFKAAASAIGGVTYRWRKGSTYLVDGGRVSGALTDTLTVTNAALADTGLYHAVATGSDTTLRKVSGGAALFVNTPPGIVANPANQPGASGSASFTVSANPGPGSSAGTLSYRWRKNSAPLSNGPTISGAETPTLNLTGVSAADSGAYDAVVTRTLNGTTSSTISLPATLTVTVGLTPGAFVFRVTPGSRYAFKLPAGTAQAKRVNMRIADMTGKVVWSASFAPEGAGQHTVYWDGRSTSGRPVAPGAYNVRITAHDAAGVTGSSLKPVTLLP